MLDYAVLWIYGHSTVPFQPSDLRRALFDSCVQSSLKHVPLDKQLGASLKMDNGHKPFSFKLWKSARSNAAAAEAKRTVLG